MSRRVIRIGAGAHRRRPRCWVVEEQLRGGGWAIVQLVGQGKGRARRLGKRTARLLENRTRVRLILWTDLTWYDFRHVAACADDLGLSRT